MLIKIAIDGPAGAGKSSIAKAVAKRFNINHLDTGLLYRAVGFYMLQKGGLYDENFDLEKELENFKLKIKYYDEKQHILINDNVVEKELRNSDVSMAASFVSKNFVVRRYLLKLQQDFAKKNGVVMDGRDIGTVVLKDANVKIFLTASLQVRAFRRFEELKLKGEKIELEQVLEDIKKRDFNDKERKISPLKIAKDAKIVDSSKLTLKQSIEKVISIIEKELA